MNTYRMSNRAFWAIAAVLVAAVLTVALAQRSASYEYVEWPTETVEETFYPYEGMSRDDVESELGAPLYEDAAPAGVDVEVTVAYPWGTVDYDSTDRAIGWAEGGV